MGRTLVSHESSSRETFPRDAQRTAIITGPPWPRSGTGRVMQNQVEYYRERGYFTVFVCVPVHCSFTSEHVDWPVIKTGLQELGADRVLIATIDPRRFAFEKYRTWVAHGFRGTALDWVVFTSKSAQLSDEDARFVRSLSVEIVHANHVFTMDFARRMLRQIVKQGARVPLLLDTHDIQAKALIERGEINPWTHRFDTVERMLDSEIAHLKKAEVLVHVSTEDLSFFEKRLPQKRHVLAMPTINERFVACVNEEVDSASVPTDILFVGQSTAPNTAAVRWFFEQVWPLLQGRSYRLRIVGGIETQVRAELPEIYEAFRSHFVGLVAELTPEYRSARCVIAPMISGTGISIKTIEALALGKPFVGTPKAYLGMPMDLLERAGLRACDTPQNFANAIVQALSEESSAARASRTAYSQLFSKQASFSSRDKALQLALGSKVSSRIPVHACRDSASSVGGANQ